MTLDYDTISKYIIHKTYKGDKVQGIQNFSNEELEFCKYCYAIINACHYLQGLDEKNKLTPIDKINNKIIKNLHLANFLNTIEKEIDCWIANSNDIKYSKYPGAKMVVPKNKLFDNELGAYYDNVIDFILLTKGYIKSNEDNPDYKRDNVVGLKKVNSIKIKTIIDSLQLKQEMKDFDMQ